MNIKCCLYIFRLLFWPDRPYACICALASSLSTTGTSSRGPSLGSSDRTRTYRRRPAPKTRFGRSRPNRFDVVVSDYEMPDGNGLELLHAVRERHPTVRRILMSGRASILPVAVADIAEAGVCKPFSTDEILKLIRGAR